MLEFGVGEQAGPNEEADPSGCFHREAAARTVGFTDARMLRRLRAREPARMS
jgi:hypothetical protein